MYYKLVDYFDVWGNPIDGYEVNDLTTVEEHIYIDDDVTEDEIVEYLFQIEYLRTTEGVKLYYYGDGWEIMTIDSFPLGRLEVADF